MSQPVCFDCNHATDSHANACAAFRSVVLNELGGIYPAPVAWPGNIDTYLHYRFAALQIAVKNFRPFVPWWKRWLFDRAWFRYYSPSGKKTDVQCYHHYMAFDSSQNPKQIFYDKVFQLLLFAR